MFLSLFLGHMVNHQRMGSVIKDCAHQVPDLDMEINIQPITRTILRITLLITAQFNWNDRVHGKVSESFWIWVEDPDNNHIYYSEIFMLHRKYVSFDL